MQGAGAHRRAAARTGDHLEMPADQVFRAAPLAKPGKDANADQRTPVGGRAQPALGLANRRLRASSHDQLAIGQRGEGATSSASSGSGTAAPNGNGTRSSVVAPWLLWRSTRAPPSGSGR